jgi:hypothetical protein
LLFPFGFELLDDFADRFARGVPSRSSADALGALVAGVGFAGVVSEDIGDRRHAFGKACRTPPAPLVDSVKPE